MKTDLHPTYYADAKVTCAGCGTVYTVGSTKKEIHVELCSNCHPFYTGKQKLVDTAGRVDRFRARQAKATGTRQRQGRPERSEGPVSEKSPADSGQPKPETGKTQTPEDRLAAMKQDLEKNQPKPTDKQ